jgi:hypothetical protein
MKCTKISFVAAILAVHGLCLSAYGEGRDPKSSWGRAIFGTQVVPVNGPQLDVDFIFEEYGELIGYCTLANVASGSYKPAKLIVDGSWRHGLFIPTIMLQVGNQYDGPWHTIRRRPSGRQSRKLTLARDQITTELRVSLEPFRRYIGKYKVGRIVVSSGDSGVFVLENLIPPDKPALRKGDSGR